MARNFLALPSQPYVGTRTSRPFKAWGQTGTMVPLNIVWAIYRANGHPLGAAHPDFAVLADFTALGPNNLSQMWQPISVYIDNEDVPFPVYCYFPDTGFAVSCPANAAGWYQIFTNSRKFVIAGIGIPDVAITQGVTQTNVFFTDVPMVPALDEEIQTSVQLWIASAAGRSGFTPGYGIPALGDLCTSYVQGAQAGAPDFVIPNFGQNVPTAGQLILTQVQCTAIGLRSSNGVPAQAVQILQGAASGQILIAEAADSVSTALANQPLLSNIVLDVHGNIRLDNDQAFFLRTQSTPNMAEAIFVWQFVWTIDTTSL